MKEFRILQGIQTPNAVSKKNKPAFFLKGLNWMSQIPESNVKTAKIDRVSTVMPQKSPASSTHPKDFFFIEERINITDKNASGM